jgi:uncharacterized RDD family membrane protein YckC
MEENTQTGQDQTDLFHDHTEFTLATQGQRFVNWLVDNILLRVVIMMLTGEIFIRLMLQIAPEYTIRIFSEDSFETYLVSYLISVVHYLFYYTICEKAFKGYTLGKLLSGTRAIRADGGELTLRDAFLRSLSRMVPFEVFSGFGEKTWHDSWTNTMVVKAR